MGSYPRRLSVSRCSPGLSSYFSSPAAGISCFLPSIETEAFFRSSAGRFTTRTVFPDGTTLFFPLPRKNDNAPKNAPTMTSANSPPIAMGKSSEPVFFLLAGLAGAALGSEPDETAGGGFVVEMEIAGSPATAEGAAPAGAPTLIFTAPSGFGGAGFAAVLISLELDDVRAGGGAAM